MIQIFKKFRQKTLFHIRNIFLILFFGFLIGDILPAQNGKYREVMHTEPRKAISLLESEMSSGMAVNLESRIDLILLYCKVYRYQDAAKEIKEMAKSKETLQKVWAQVFEKYLYLLRDKSKEGEKIYKFETLDDDVKGLNNSHLLFWHQFVEGFRQVKVNDYESAIAHLEKALAYAVEINKPDYEARVYDKMAIIFFYSRNFEKSLSINNKLLNVALTLNDDFIKNRALSSEMNIRYSMATNEEQAWHAAKRQNKDTSKFRHLEWFKRSNDLLEEVIELSKKIGDDKVLIRSMIMKQARNIGRKNYKSAIKAINETFEIIGDKPYYTELGVSYINLSGAHRNLKKFKKSLDAAAQAKKFFEKGDFTEGPLWVVEEYFLTYADMGKYKKAYEYAIEYSEISNQIMDTRNTELIHEMREKFESDIAEREIEKLNQNNKIVATQLQNQKLQTTMFSGFAILLVLLASLQFNRNKVIQSKNKILSEQKQKIEEKSMDLESVLNNISEGIITLSDIDGEILIKECSRHVYDILEIGRVSEFSKIKPIPFIFESSSLNTEQLSLIETLVITSMGENELQWVVNKDHLPQEMLIGDSDKIIELDWNIVTKDEVILKILLTLKDVTEVRDLQKRQEQADITTKKLIAMTIMGQKEYLIFIKSVDQLLRESENLIEKTHQFNRDVIDHVFRNLHTLKGLARNYDLDLLSSFIHEIEGTFHEVRDGERDYDQSELETRLQSLDSEVDTYQKIAKTKLKWDPEQAEVSLPIAELSQWHHQLSEIKQEGGRSSKSSLDILLTKIKKKYASTLSDALYEIRLSANKLSKELGKGEIEISISGVNQFVNSSYMDNIRFLFVHLFRNSVDHGFETIEDRRTSGRPNPLIKLHLERVESRYILKYADNGKGLNLDALFTKAEALRKNIERTEIEKLAQLIFEQGLSTKEVVTDISGRGVGMDAVKHFLKETGGDIQIVLEGQVVDSFAPFHFLIELPDQYFDL